MMLALYKINNCFDKISNIENKGSFFCGNKQVRTFLCDPRMLGQMCI